MEREQLSTCIGDTIELHYWLKDESHTMDAFIQNKCELELLKIVKEIALKLDVEVIIETEPFLEGGLIRYFKIIAKEEKKKALITTAVLTALATTILVVPIGKVIEKLVDKAFEDKEFVEYTKEGIILDNEIKRQTIEEKKLSNEGVKLENSNKKLRNIQLQNEIRAQAKSKVNELNEDVVIKKRKSNFFENLVTYSKVEKVSVLLVDDNKKPISKELFVSREQFNQFIIVSDDLEPIIIDNAIIEIVSPVLKKGKYKWTGIYEEETISFIMKSNEFKTLVQTGKVEFKNGSTINCQLVKKRKIDSEGVEKIVGYEVELVNSYYENSKPIETAEGRKYKKTKEIDKQQTKLWD